MSSVTVRRTPCRPSIVVWITSAGPRSHMDGEHRHVVRGGSKNGFLSNDPAELRKLDCNDTGQMRTGAAMRPTLLHITNGESAGDTLRQTALGGAVLAWQDALHEGPVPALPRKDLLRTRSRFLADCGWGRQETLLSSLERRDQQLLEALHDDAQVVLWFEHDLFDQLQLLDVLTLAHTAAAA